MDFSFSDEQTLLQEVQVARDNLAVLQQLELQARRLHGQRQCDRGH